MDFSNSDHGGLNRLLNLAPLPNDIRSDLFLCIFITTTASHRNRFKVLEQSPSS